MQFGLIINKYRSYILFFFLVWASYKVGEAIATGGSYRILYVFLSISVLGTSLYFVRIFGSLPAFCAIVFCFWMPVRSRLDTLFPYLYRLYPAEAGIWILCFVILANKLVFSNRKIFENQPNISYLPWLLFIGSALIANAGDYSILTVTKIRVICILPLLIIFASYSFVKTVRDAERAIWVLLISGVLFGLVVLYAPQMPPEQLDYTTMQNVLDSLERGRLAKVFSVPRCETLYYNSGAGGIFFAILSSLAFSLFLNHSSTRKRWAAGIFLAIYLYILIESQGRSSLAALLCSMVTVTLLSIKFHKGFFFSKAALLLQFGVVIVSSTVFLIYTISSLTDEIFLSRFQGLLSNPLSAHGVLDRIERWKYSLEVYLDNFFWGVGLYGFPAGLTNTSWYAHNLYLYFALSFGILGFIGFFWIMANHTKIFWIGLHSSSNHMQMLSIGGLGCIVVLLIAGQGSCYFSGVYHAFGFWLPIGIISAAVLAKN